MSERRDPNLHRKMTMAAMAGCLLLSAAHNAGSENVHSSAPTHGSESTIEQCYDQPQPQQSPDVAVPSHDLSPISLPMQDGFVKGNPAANKHTFYSSRSREVTRSIVKIIVTEQTTSGVHKSKGSGFLIKDKNGDQVVATAGHVVAAADSLKDITITTKTTDKPSAADSQHPSGGCYILENDGVQFALGAARDNKGYDADMAVLKLPHTFETRPNVDAPLALPNTFETRPSLTLAEKPVNRGDWVFFDNYQGDHEPSYSAFYSGLVVNTPGDGQGLGLRTLTALQSLEAPTTMADTEVDNVQLQPGASGGVVIDADNGQIVGMSTWRYGGSPRDPGSMKKRYNSSFPGAHYGRDGGFVPVVAGLMPVSLIRAALNAPTG